MDTPQRRILPYSPPALVVVALAAAGWGGLWVVVIPPAMLPVAYVVPLAIGFWTGRRSALWLSAAFFAALTVAKAALATPESTDTIAWVAAALACIAGGTAATLWLLYRNEPAVETVATPAAPVPVALSSASTESRHDFLQLLLRSLTRPDPHGLEFPRVLGRIQALVGAPADGCAVIALDGDECRVLAAVGAGAAALPRQFPLAGSPLAGLRARTLDFGGVTAGAVFGPARSAVVAPDAGPEPTCVLAAWSTAGAAWSEAQIATLAWAATQARHWLEARVRPSPSRAPFPVQPAESAPRRILLVEDHADTGLVLTRVLRNEGHDVTHARDTGEAVARFTAQPFDLVITDLGLPDGNGAELMARLRTQRPALPGICVTGFEPDLVATELAGFCAHLTKPVDIRQLKAAIARALPGHPHR